MTDEIVPGMAETIEARRKALSLNPGQFAERAGLTREGARRVRNGHRRKYQDDTINGVARTLRWEASWYDQLLAGERPIETDRDEPADIHDRLSRLEDHARRVDETLDLILERLQQP